MAYRNSIEKYMFSNKIGVFGIAYQSEEVTCLEQVVEVSTCQLLILLLLHQKSFFSFFRGLELQHNSKWLSRWMVLPCLKKIG